MTNSDREIEAQLVSACREANASLLKEGSGGVSNKHTRMLMWVVKDIEAALDTLRHNMDREIEKAS